MDQRPDRASSGWRLFLRALPERWSNPDLAFLAAVAVLYLVTVRPFYGLTVDDAYIGFRYADNWARGCGPVFNCGQPPVEGYTAFLWVGLEALVIKLGLSVVETTRFLGLLAGFACLLVLRLLCRRLHGERLADWVPLLGLASCPFWGVNAVAGVDTLAATLTILIAAHFSVDLPTRPRPWLAGLAWSASYLMRPEGLLFAFLTGLWSLGAGLARGAGWRRTLVGTVQYGAAFLAVSLPYFLWRYFYYDSLFANTFIAKKEPLERVLPHNYKLLAEHWPFFVALGLAALVALSASILRRRGALLYPFLLALASAAISFTVHNEFWRPGHRLFLTAVALIAVVAAGVADLRQPRARTAWARWPGHALGLGLLAVLVAFNWTVFPATKAGADLHYAKDDHPTVRMGARIRTMARPGDWLAVRDAGMVPFHAGWRVNVLDMHDRSLNDRRIARQGWDLSYVMGHDPRFVILVSYSGQALELAHPVEGRILHSPGFSRRYRHIMTVPWHHQRHYFLYARD